MVKQRRKFAVNPAIICLFFIAITGEAVQMLEDGVPVHGIASCMHDKTCFYIRASTEDLACLKFATSGGDGTATVFIRKGEEPKTEHYDFISNTGQEILIPGTEKGAYYYICLFDGMGKVSNLSLVADVLAGGDCGCKKFCIGHSIQGLSSEVGHMTSFCLQSVKDREGEYAMNCQYKVEMKGDGDDNGDADMYLVDKAGDCDYNHNPTTPPVDYDQRPYIGSSTESISFTTTEGRSYYLLVHAHKDYKNVNLKYSVNCN